MVNSEERKPAGGQRIDDVDPSDQIIDAEDSTVNVSSSGDRASARENRSVTRRLTEIFVEDGDGDLLLQRSDREDGVIQWLRALDMQVMGACRADERLKPLLKLNTSADVAEDPLLAHLSQHFEPAEVGMLARCLCMPLVSVRVGKINKQGTLFLPTSIRGNLCLTLLPTSDLRISFNGDDGSIERLVTLSTESQRNYIEIQDISADKSGRSFFIKTLDGIVSHFWCSEKSKLLGTELLRKMKDLLTKKPSLAELTGICDSRLNCFATHFRAYLAGSVLTNTYPSDSSMDSSDIHFPQSSSTCQTNLIHPGPPNPVSTSFKEDGLQMVNTSIDITSVTSLDVNDPLPLNFFDILEKSPDLSCEIQIPTLSTSPFTPHYCWCPPIIQSTMQNPQLPISSSESSSLPPLSLLLTSTPLPIDFPNLPPEPLVRLPTSQQIPTFTPLICDPIIHVPVIDVCSSGQGYFVSGGPAIPNVVVDPLLPKSTESLVEKSARETLRMLISSSNQENIIDVLSNDKENVNVVAGSRGLYSGTQDVDTMEMILSLDGSGKRCGLRENVMDQKEKKNGRSSNDPSGFDE